MHLAAGSAFRPARTRRSRRAGRSAGRSTVAAQGTAVLILSPEAAAHFYPATPEQVVNACYAAGLPDGAPRRHRRRTGGRGVPAPLAKTSVGHPDPLHRSGGGGDGADRLSGAGAVPGAGDDSGGGGGAVPAGALRAGCSGSCTRASRRRVVHAGARCRRHLRGPGADLPAPAQCERPAQPDVLRADSRGAAAPPERGGRAAAGHARGGAAREPPVPHRARAAAPAGAGPRGGGGPARPGVRGHALVRGGARPPAPRARGTSCTGGGRCWRAPSRRGAGARWWMAGWWPASAPRSTSGPGGCRPIRRRWRRCSTPIGPGPNGQALGLRGLRLHHLRPVRRGGGAGPGHAPAVSAATRSGGRKRPRARRRWTC